MCWFQFHKLKDFLLFLVNQRSFELSIKQKTHKDVTFGPANTSLNFCHRPELLISKHLQHLKKLNNQLLFSKNWNPGYFKRSTRVWSRALWRPIRQQKKTKAARQSELLSDIKYLSVFFLQCQRASNDPLYNHMRRHLQICTDIKHTVSRACD